ncbi:amidohydrolase family protein [Sphingomicrobium aestuariivivum]|uniref:amidohydrolase family protein n=1 Tax=Sphingomicrobium aestuariivivum TaxID=1582356 RepID=UPI001FD6E262|nr:amidohydrolase family protein [Sphingomicrobium aestuariivivum]MCJ8190972.1 amidohydrolase family protein [Sphingomicrobium aestuariivivum]
MKFITLAATAALAAAAAGCTSAPQATVAATSSAAMPAAIGADVLIRDVRVIDPATRRVLEAQDVLVEGGSIVALHPTGSARVAARQVVDGRGLTLLPGYIDMHAHVGYGMLHETTLALMLANGITGLRDMSADCPQGEGPMNMCRQQLLESREKIAAGQLAGPTLLSLGTAKIDSNRPDEAQGRAARYHVATPEQAREAVAAFDAEGMTFLKVSQEFMPDAFEALLDEASARDLGVAGHVPLMFSVGEVAAMGMSSIEHARDLPLDCSRHGAVFRGAVAAALTGAGDWPDRAAMPGLARDSFDPSICEAQIAAMREAGTGYVPTHLTREMDYRAADPAYRGDPRFAYVPALQKHYWDRDLDRTAAMPDALRDDLEDFYRLGLRTTKLAHDAGVPVMVGTDANDTMSFPGFSYHDEMSHLVAAGLSEMDVLRAATSVAAGFLGREDLGAIAPGQRADLVLLSGDPLADIDDSDTIVAVVHAGRLHGRDQLDALLADVEDKVAAMGAGAAGNDAGQGGGQ